MTISTETSRDAESAPAYLILDTESIPDGKLLAQTKYPGENLTPEQAVERAQAEAGIGRAEILEDVPVARRAERSQFDADGADVQTEVDGHFPPVWPDCGLDSTNRT